MLALKCRYVKVIVCWCRSKQLADAAMALMLIGVVWPVWAEMPKPPTLDVPHTTLSPAIEADPLDTAWHRAAVVRDLGPSWVVKRGSDPPKPRPEPSPDGASLQTEVRLLWDRDHLYVRFICHDLELFVPHGLDHDAPHYKGDVVEVFIDGIGDGRQWLEVQVNPAGGVLDLNTVMSAPPESDAMGVLTQVSDRQRWPNLGYTTKGLKTAARAVEGGWLADFAIPAAVVLRRSGERVFAPDAKLRANLLRYEKLLNEDGSRRFVAQNWSPVIRGNPHRSPARMGTLRLTEPAAKAGDSRAKGLVE